VRCAIDRLVVERAGLCRPNLHACGGGAPWKTSRCLRRVRVIFVPAWCPLQQLEVLIWRRLQGASHKQSHHGGLVCPAAERESNHVRIHLGASFQINRYRWIDHRNLVSTTVGRKSSMFLRSPRVLRVRRIDRAGIPRRTASGLVGFRARV